MCDAVKALKFFHENRNKCCAIARGIKENNDLKEFVIVSNTISIYNFICALCKICKTFGKFIIPKIINRILS